MAQWFVVNNAAKGLVLGNAGWTNLSNATAGAFKIALVNEGTANFANVTVANFLASGSAETQNYTRPSLASVAFNYDTADKPKWTAANVNIVFTGAGGSCNYAAIYQVQPGSADSDTNVIAISNLGATTVSGGSNLVLDLSAGILIADDPNT